MSDSSDERDPIERLADSFLARYRRGERPCVDEYTAKYPELADEIGELLPALVLLEQEKSVQGAATTGEAGRVEALTGALKQLGEYQLLREIGRGGMGVVYEAMQQSLGRHVALKVLPMHGLGGSSQLERFRLEARAAARLHHTNIVPVFGTGEAEGVHYYAMQFIQGQGLDVIIDELRRLRDGEEIHPAIEPTRDAGDGLRPSPATLTQAFMSGRLVGTSAFDPAATLAETEAGSVTGGPIPPLTAPDSPEFRLSTPVEPADPVLSNISELSTARSESQYYRSVARVGLQVAQALAYAHGEGILHRDIKPSNLLMDAKGVVWVTDFGLAKAEGSDGPTQTGDIVGTLRYMAPERFDGWSDPRSDVYALGATLYELLTLRPLFEDANRARLIERVLHENPIPPRKIDRRIPRDLETIVLKALAKEPAGRYATAAAMAEDLQRFADDKAILARRSTLPERLVRWARHNKAIAASLGVIAGLLVAGMIGLGVATARFRAQAIAKAELARDNEVARVNADRARVQADQARQETAEALRKAETTLADIHTSYGLVAASGNDPARAMLWFASAGRLAEHDPDRVRLNRVSARLWSRETALPVAVLEHESQLQQMEFRPGGDHLLTRTLGNRCTVWDWTREEPLPWARGMERVSACGWSPDGEWLALGSPSGQVVIRAMPSGAVLHRFETGSPVKVLAFRPDGGWLAVAGAGVRLWDCRAQALSNVVLEHPRPIRSLTFSPRGETLATACDDDKVRVFDLPERGEPSSRPRFDPLPHFNHSAGDMIGMLAPAFVNDGRGLVTITGPNQLTLWNALTGRPDVNGQIATQANALWGVAVSPDGSLVAAVGSKGVPFGPQLIDLRTRIGQGKPLEHRNYVTQLVFSPDRTLMATTSWDRTAKLWSLPDGSLVGSPLIHQGNVLRAAFSPDSCFLATAQSDGLVRVWRRPAGRPADHKIPAHPQNNFAVLSPDGRQAVASRFKFFGWGLPDGQVRVHDVATGMPLGPAIRLDGILREAALSPSGTRVAVAYETGAAGTQVGRLALHDFTSGASGFAPLALPGVPSAIAFSPDGKCLAAYSRGGFVTLIETIGGRVILRLRHELPGGTRQANDRVLFTPDGSSLITLGEDRRVQVWDLERGTPRFPRLEPSYVSDVAVSPDGRLLATVTYLGTPKSNVLMVWDLRTGRPVSPPMTHPGWIFQVVFSADGRRVLTGARDGQARLWDWKAGRLASPPMNHEDEVYGVALTPDGRWGLTACRDGNVRVWDLRLAKPVGPPIAVIATSSGAAFSVTVSSDGGRVSGPRVANQFGPPIMTVVTSRSAVFNVTVSSDGSRAVAGTGEPYLLSLDLSGLDDGKGTDGDELAALAEVVSGLRVDAGNLSNLTAEEWIERWRDLRRLHPEPFEPSVAGVTDSRAISTRPSRLRDASPSQFDALTPLIGRYPNLPGPRIERGRFYAERGKGAAADADFATAAAQVGIGTQSFLDAGWWVVGPYVESLLLPFPPESDPDPSKPVASVAASAPLRWKYVSTESTGRLDLASAIGPLDHCSAYALNYVFAPSPREEIWAIGSDDAVKLWLNGEWIYQRTSPGNTLPDYARVRVKLRAGRNTVLARVTNSAGHHRLYLRNDPSPLASGMIYGAQGDWDRAESEFDEAVRRAPTDLAMLRALAEFQGRHGRWDTVTRTYDRLLMAGTTEHWDLYQATALILKRDGLEGFRRHRRQMLELFAQSTNVTIAERIGKACLLAPLPGPDQDEGLRLALHTDMTPGTGKTPWNHLTRSLAEYRGGLPEKAVAFARQVTASRPERWAWNYSAYAVLSMSLLRLGQVDEARKALDQAREIDRKVTPKPGGYDFGGYWCDKVIGDCLVREAELALQDHDFPSNPFARP